MLFRRDISELDPFSQRELFVSFRNLVFQSINRILGDYYLTEDIIQEAFIKAMLRGPYTKHAKNISAWLLQVSRNTAYDFLRKYKKMNVLIRVNTR